MELDDTDYLINTANSQSFKTSVSFQRLFGQKTKHQVGRRKCTESSDTIYPQGT